MIHGAAGGVGTFAVQLARWRGANVIATGSAHNIDFLKELGANQVIDYTAVGFEETVSGVDVVLDTIGGDTLERSWAVLRAGGVLVTIADSIPAGKPEQYGLRGVFFIVQPSRPELIEIGRLLDAGVVQSVIAEVLPLDRAQEAFKRGSGWHTGGKIVLRVGPEEKTEEGCSLLRGSESRCSICVVLSLTHVSTFFRARQSLQRRAAARSSRRRRGSLLIPPSVTVRSPLRDGSTGCTPLSLPPGRCS